MVFIVKNFEDIKEQLAHCRLTFYRIIEHEDKMEIRVKAGSIAWKGYFDKKDARLEEIKKLLNTYQAIEVVATMADDIFLA